MRFVRRLTITIVMTALLLAPSTAFAEPADHERVSDLYAYAAENQWGPAEWAEFELWVNLVRLYELSDQATRGDTEAWRQLVWLVFGSDAPRALEISWRESRWTAGAVNHTGCYEAGVTWKCWGGFQMHGRYVDGRMVAAGQDPALRMDALPQIVTAHHLFVQSGRRWCPHWC